MSDTNGHNGHGNGNGKAKVFELAPVKGPEEAEQEYVREIAPKIRRRVFCDPEISPGAKFFFAVLLDFTFLKMFGGSGRGILYMTVKNLCGVLNHDPKSIRAWRDELAARGWIWFQDEWPICQWRICPVCPPPEGRAATPYQMTLGKAAAEEQSRGEKGGEGDFPLGVFSAKNGNSPRKVQCFPQSVPEGSPSQGETFPSARGDFPLSEGNLSTQTEGKSPTPPTKVSTLQGESLVTDEGKVSPQRGESLPPIKESPRRIGASGDNGGGNEAPAPQDSEFEGWKADMRRLFPDKREPHRKRIEAQMARRGDSPQYLAWCRRRLDFLNELSMGGKPPVGAKAAPKVAAPVKATAAPTREELLEGARYLIGQKKANKLTKEQRQLLQEVGEL